MEEKTCVLLKYILTALDKQSMIGIPSRRTDKTLCGSELVSRLQETWTWKLQSEVKFACGGVKKKIKAAGGSTYLKVL